MNNIVLSVKGTLDRTCSKTQIMYTFNITEKIEEMTINFRYDPKDLEDKDQSKIQILEGLNKFTDSQEEYSEYEAKWEQYLPLHNLITVSLDDSNGFRGCAHKQDPVQVLTIGKDQATYGFIKGDFPTGLYRVILSVHAVVTEQCEYSLHITAK